MRCQVYELNYLKDYKYVVVLSEHDGKIILSRHKGRTTWETQGGHIETGETPLDAAKRELFEESGAVDYDILPLCDYRAWNEKTGHGANGVVFHAVIHEFGAMHQSEMAEICEFTVLPEKLTYPAITPVLFAHLARKPLLHYMKLKSSPFHKIQSGTKTIELRLNDEKRQQVQVGDFIEFTMMDDASQKLTARVIALHHFDSFTELYENLPKEKIGYAPDEIPNPNHMDEYYPREKQAQYGVLGIEIEVMNVINYRIANKKDAYELTRLRIEYMKEAFNGISNDEDLRLSHELPVYFEKNLGVKCIAFIAEKEKHMVGCALLILIEKPYSPVLKTGIVGEVMGVYTEPYYRNRGIATKLMSDMVEYAKENKLDRIDLNASDDGLHVYRKVGFIENDSPYVSMNIIL